MPLKSEAVLLSTMILVSLGIIVSLLTISYISALIMYYRDQVEVVNLIQDEASRTIVNLIMYDNSTNTIWLLIRRLDGMPTTYYLIVATDRGYLNCSHIRFYNPAGDIDGIMCNNPAECVISTLAYHGSMNNVYVVMEGGVDNLLTYARVRGYPTASIIQGCRVPSVCELKGIRGICNESTITRIEIPSGVQRAWIFIATMYNNRLYILKTYEVSLG